MGGHGGIEARYQALPAESRPDLVDEVAGRAAAGHAEALDELLGLIDAHRLDRAAIRRLVVDDTAIDDIHQDVLIRVANGITTFRGGARFGTWLHTVARNTAIDHLRRQRPESPLDDEALPDHERVSSLIAQRADLVSAMEELPEHYRSVVTLRDVEGQSYQVIADRLDLPINTVRSRLARGRALVAQRLER